MFHIFMIFYDKILLKGSTDNVDLSGKLSSVRRHFFNANSS